MALIHHDASEDLPEKSVGRAALSSMDLVDIVTIFLLFRHILLVSFNTSCRYWRGLCPSNDTYLVVMGPTSFFLSHL